jgi:hypothetical protein
LKFLFNNDVTPTLSTTIGSGLVATTTSGNFYLALHTADPGVGGAQTTNEITGGGYARLPVARSTGGFTVGTTSVTLASPQIFPTGSGVSGTVTYFSIGTAATGTGQVLYTGTVTPNIVLGASFAPQLGTGTTVTEV